jgi:mono/diheme cytochrome c family protein
MFFCQTRRRMGNPLQYCQQRSDKASGEARQAEPSRPGVAETPSRSKGESAMNFRSSGLPCPDLSGNNLLQAAALLLALMLAGCGGGGGSSPAALDTNAPEEGSSFTITSDDYGLQKPGYLSASRGSNGVVLRAAIASSMTDPQFRTVARVDVPNPDAVAAGTVYSLGAAGGGNPSFPGTIYVFNGHPSTLLQTTGGTIAFTSYGTNPGDRVSGTFTAVIVDGNDATFRESYTIAASFNYRMGDYGPVIPAPAPVPLEAAAIYSSRCAGCHTLGSVDGSGSAPELALKGGHIETLFEHGSVDHQGVRLAAEEVSALKILLNAN